MKKFEPITLTPQPMDVLPRLYDTVVAFHKEDCCWYPMYYGQLIGWTWIHEDKSMGHVDLSKYSCWIDPEGVTPKEVSNEAV